MWQQARLPLTKRPLDLLYVAFFIVSSSTSLPRTGTSYELLTSILLLTLASRSVLVVDGLSSPLSAPPRSLVDVQPSPLVPRVDR